MRFGKSFKIALAVAALAALVLILAAAAIKITAEGALKREIAKYINSPFGFKSVDISLIKDFPQIRIDLQDFYIDGTKGSSPDVEAFLKAEGVSASINALSLFSREHEISKIVFEGLYVNATIYSNGEASWDVFKKNGGEGETVYQNGETVYQPRFSGLKIFLKNFVVKNSSVKYFDERNGFYALVQDFSVLAALDIVPHKTFLGLHGGGKLSIGKDDVPFLEKAALSLKINADGDPKEGSVTFTESVASINGISADLTGRIFSSQGVFFSDVVLQTGETDIKGLTAAFPKSWELFRNAEVSGSAALYSVFKGPFSRHRFPGLSVSLETKNAALKIGDKPALIDHGTANIRMEKKEDESGRTFLADLNFLLAGEPFSASFSYPEGKEKEALLTARGTADLDKIREALPDASRLTAGMVITDARAEGDISAFEKRKYDELKIEGTFLIKGIEMEIKDTPPLLVKKAVLEAGPGSLKFDKALLFMGNDEITVSGNLKNYSGFFTKNGIIEGVLNARSDSIDLNMFIEDYLADKIEGKISKDLDKSKESPGTAVTPISGKAGERPSGRKFLKIPENMDLKIDADVKKVFLGGMTFTDVKGVLFIKDGSVNIKGVSFNAWSGLNADILKSEAARKAAEKIGIDLEKALKDKESLVKSAIIARDRLLEEAKKQTDALIEKAGNFPGAEAAKAAAELLMEEARKQADKLVQEAQKKGDDIIRNIMNKEKPADK